MFELCLKNLQNVIWFSSDEYNYTFSVKKCFDFFIIYKVCGNFIRWKMNKIRKVCYWSTGSRIERYMFFLENRYMGCFFASHVNMFS
jgi:hypothetical protein